MYPVPDFPAIQPGIEKTIERTVDSNLVTRHVGGAGTFATPAMIGLMEQCSHKLIEPLLGDAYTTVGFEVCVKHLKPSEPGSRVSVTSRLAEVTDGRKLLFDVECREGDKLCGTGTHRRTIVAAFGPNPGAG